MPSDSTLATLSDNLTNGATAIYLFAALAFAAVFAYRRTRETVHAEAPAERVAERVLVGVGGGVGGGAAPAESPPPPPEVPRQSSVFTADSLSRWAVGLTVVGWAVHLGALTARGFAADRAPWANMYEFVCSVVFAAVTALLVLFTRNRAYYLGVFVMFPAVLGMGLATTTLYTPVSALQPSLQSYWLAIHVLAAIIASGAFTVATALTALYLYRDRNAGTGPATGLSTLASLATRLPSARTLERLARQTVVFAFPIWTFAIIAGAIWADSAWGRYWGWDPKEVWAFITWTVYAAYLHAQATTGWRGRRSAMISLAGYACLMFNLVGINIWGSGLHSYAGL
ncbi:c-type cytochrome biogenesis protein CcsB [Actinomadura spongiicola]|uniref:C-type cytochrome biogenesis protein CcsB n=1 Tax=Actinomadura spongiicola TaxID=2303421 RepID=A0A372GCB2_9ACTN|nr:c-type cytochrome biogenesis protein CcsB [Actinomadura spongiicola]RFS83034.1 c-type cytochrome biogenesis protein CcsB [Actinomadura spongiicola]